jgi:hypothetical protein
MKRKDAFRKLRVICQRLDEVDPEQFLVVPLRLYLLGSLLTDKPNPLDIDLLFEYRESPHLDPGDIVHRLSYGKPLPHEQAVKHLRRGMKMIRVEFLMSSVEGWLRDRFFPPDTPVRSVWEPGLDWRQVVDEIESHPAPWDPALEKRHKYLQETVKQIIQERGVPAAREWFRKQVER